MLGCLSIATPAAADEPPGGASAQTFPMWWSGAGMPGWTPDAQLSGEMPWTFAGLTSGGWTLHDPFGAAIEAGPGVPEAQVPLAWYDSAAVVIGQNGGWNGFGAGLADAQGMLRPPAGRKPRAVFTTVTGSAGVDRDAIFLSRGDARDWLRAGAIGDKRGAVSDLELAGDHLWTISGGARRGAQLVDGQFTQRGAAERQRDGGLGNGANGQEGAVDWAWARHGDSLGVRGTRGLDARDEYFAGYNTRTLRRDAQENGLDVTLQRRRAGGELGLRLRLREARVIDVLEPYFAAATGVPERTEWNTRSTWLAARAAGDVDGGRLELQLGGGFDRSPARRAARAQLAPSLTWTVTQGDRSVRVFAERTVDPVWSDLAVGQPAFMQDLWCGGFDVAAGKGGPRHADVLLVAGSAGNRGTLLRYPIPSDALFAGWLADAHRYNFLLLRSTAAASWRAFSTDASGWALARNLSPQQSFVDPVVGGTAGAGTAFRLFTGDLGVRLRAQVAYVGARETDTGGGAEPGESILPTTVLPAYAAVSASAHLTLGDATIVLRADGLEGTRHEETWVDPSQLPGPTLARDAGLQYRAELIWPLFN